ncbi:MAG: hypothetical protein WA172_18855 [Terriglobales bacterium]
MLSSRAKTNCGGAASTVGEGEGCGEEGGVADWGACCDEYASAKQKARTFTKAKRKPHKS